MILGVGLGYFVTKLVGVMTGIWVVGVSTGKFEQATKMASNKKINPLQNTRLSKLQASFLQRHPLALTDHQMIEHFHIQ